MDLLNSEPSCGVYRLGFKDHWELGGCISISESILFVSLISTVDFLGLEVGGGKIDL